jgi:hypothetical protein
MTAIKTLTVAALNAAATFNDRVEAIRAALPAKTLRDKKLVADALREGVASFYGMELVERGKSMVFPSEHAKTPAAKQSLKRLVNSVIGETMNKKASEGIEVPAHIAKLAEQLAKACAAYEDSRKIANTAVAQAFTK